MSNVPAHHDPHAHTRSETKRADNQLEANAKASRKNSRRKHRSRSKRSLPARILIRASWFVVLLYLGILLTMILMESRLVYPGAFFADGARSIAANPEIQNVPYQSTDGLTLTGRLLEKNDASEVVLFLHGNGTKAAWLDGWTQRLSTAFNANVLTAEYRGFGDGDDAKPFESGVIEDCFAARDFLCERYKIKPSQIIVYGRSLGGGCASAIASRGGAKVLVLEKTFDHLVNVAADRYPFFPIRRMMKNRFDNVARLTNYQGPLVILHGAADQIIPIDHGRQLFDSYGNGPKDFIEISGLGHNDAISDSTLIQAAHRTMELMTANEQP